MLLPCGTSNVLASCETNFAVASLLLLQANRLQEWRKPLFVLWIGCGEASLVSLIAEVGTKELVTAASIEKGCLQVDELERDCLSLPVLLR